MTRIQHHLQPQGADKLRQKCQPYGPWHCGNASTPWVLAANVHTWLFTYCESLKLKLKHSQIHIWCSYPGIYNSVWKHCWLFWEQTTNYMVCGTHPMKHLRNKTSQCEAKTKKLQQMFTWWNTTTTHHDCTNRNHSLRWVYSDLADPCTNASNMLWFATMTTALFCCKFTP